MADEEPAAFYDARCPACNAKIGWHGTVRDQPKCWRCGAKPDQKAMDEDARHVAEFRKLLARRKETPR